jgi:hypothetical protein
VSRLRCDRTAESVLIPSEKILPICERESENQEEHFERFCVLYEEVFERNDGQQHPVAMRIISFITRSYQSRAEFPSFPSDSGVIHYINRLNSRSRAHESLKGNN